MRNLTFLCAALLILLNCYLPSCSTNSTEIEPNQPAETGMLVTEPGDVQTGSASGWPVGLPQDGVQPWERLSAQGCVTPTRRASGINADSDYTVGRDRFLEGGDVTDSGEASFLDSGPDWSGDIAWAMYRIPMGGSQPGVVGVDAYLRSWTTGELSSYYVGISNYNRDTWDWYGPFMDPHARLSLPSGDYLSPLSNLLVCILTYDGDRASVVGISTNPLVPGDTSAPDPPAALAATPVRGGLLLEWTPVVAADLAGYRIYWDYSPISDVNRPTVNAVDYLIGKQEYLLDIDQTRVVYVRLTAVDINGNESTLSPQAQGLPFSGDVMQVITSTDYTSGQLGTTVTLDAYGPDVNSGDTFDWDGNGDGIYEVAGDTTGTLVMVLDQPGIIRPAVRVHGSDGKAMACGAVSLIVSGNTRPVASCTAIPSNGPCPLTVSLLGTAEDAEDGLGNLEFAWDINGDGIYESGPAYNSLTPPEPTYADPGIFNVKFRVTDTEGSWDVDTVAVNALDISPWFTTVTCGWANVASGNELEIVDGHPAQVFEDLNNNGVYFTRSIDAEGKKWSGAYPLGICSGKLDLKVVNGNPAVCWYDPAAVSLAYRRSADSDGSQWTTMPLTIMPGGGTYPSMEIVNGYPGIVCLDAPGISFIRATDADGTAWGVQVLIDTTPATTGSALAIVNGNPAVAWTDMTGTPILKFSRADDQDGTAWSTVITVDSGPAATGYNPSMAMVNGRVAIAYWDIDNRIAWYVRATHANGATWNAPVRINPSGTEAVMPSLAMLDGVPVIAYLLVDDLSLVFSRGLDADGSAWSEPEIVDNQNYNGSFPSLDTSTGVPMVTYLERTNRNLMFARPR